MTQSERGIFETGNEVLQQVLQRQKYTQTVVKSHQLSLLIAFNAMICILYVFIYSYVLYSGLYGFWEACWLAHFSLDKRNFFVAKYQMS